MQVRIIFLLSFSLGNERPCPYYICIQDRRLWIWIYS